MLHFALSSLRMLHFALSSLRMLHFALSSLRMLHFALSSLRMLHFALSSLRMLHFTLSSLRMLHFALSSLRMLHFTLSSLRMLHFAALSSTLVPFGMAGSSSTCLICGTASRDALVVGRKEELPVPLSTWEEFVEGNPELDWGPPGDRALCSTCVQTVKDFHAMKLELAEKRRSLLNQLQQKLKTPSEPSPPVRRPRGRPRKARNNPETQGNGDSALYQKSWESESGLKDWIAPVPAAPREACCKLCKVSFDALRRAVDEHAASSKHVENAQSLEKLFEAGRPRRRGRPSIKALEAAEAVQLRKRLKQEDDEDSETDEKADVEIKMLQEDLPTSSGSVAFVLRPKRRREGRAGQDLKTLKVQNPLLLQHCKPVSVTRFSCCSCAEVFDTEREFLFHYELNHSESNAGLLPSSLTEDAKKVEMIEVPVDLPWAPGQPIPWPDDGMVRCRFCEVSFATKHEFDEHAAKTHGVPEDSEYSYNDSTTSLPDDASKWNRPSRTFMCTVPKCRSRRIFKEWKAFCLHLKKGHRMGDPSICLVCDQVFTDISIYMQHVKEHDSRGDPLQCELCKVVFYAYSDLVEHQRECHKQRSYRCKYCPSQFMTSRERAFHIQCHESERPHQCAVCGKRFENPRQLRCHMVQAHDNALPCMLCEKSFTTKDELDLHEGSHDECMTCGKKGFDSVDALKKHILHHERTPGRTCEHCGVEYKLEASLVRHLAEKHGVGEQEPLSISLKKNKPFKKVHGDIVLNENQNEEGGLLDWSDEEPDGGKKHHTLLLPPAMEESNKEPQQPTVILKPNQRRIKKVAAEKRMVSIPQDVDETGTMYMLLDEAGNSEFITPHMATIVVGTLE
ncbi:unnamed protein product [Cyprideis torosa]|uniref:Uncharacterized protein n=1 Tax=Cyprideis torosa TaxID=163714 RepID=A0A7R8WPS6_9CRUS|nr:unnamed protein product [Cyprideis torosa]CAG0901647.1 unnamed protein product [Cyprideis torosa]